MKILMKIIKFIFTLLIIAAIILLGMVVYNKYSNYKTEKEQNRDRIRASLQNSIEDSKTKQEENHNKYGNPAKTDDKSDENGTDGSNESDNNGEKQSVVDKIKTKFTDIKEELTSEDNSVKVDPEEGYNTQYFDAVLLLYEGQVTGDRAIEALDKIIENADQHVYSYVDVTAKNIGNFGTITHDDKDTYVSQLKALRNSLNSGTQYTISFGYSKFKTHIDEVIIEK